ncbi:potassium channel family protein [Ferrimonas balearica]|uniref:potassium channel family protein n=1 Tax=Ferrimonas balearica TaxID=44012 RepID=UPI001C9998A7|nr:potassium channel family protein [Ferrimonas balearica]MBY5992327.1 potassium channel family protein [Ferrimonas balearica]
MSKETEHTLTPREMGMMLLSLFSVIVVLTIVFSDNDKETIRLLIKIDFYICMIFIVNFFYGLWRAEQKGRYLQTHWIDLVASIPVVEQLRFVRIFQILRVVRLIRMSRSVLGPLLQQKRETTLTSLLLAMITIITFASILILLVEDGVEGANIQSAESAIWWALITISTVGYGDYYPVTTEGRVIAAVVIITGVSFFGVVAGFLASLFVREEDKDAPEVARLQAQQRRLEHQQAQLLEEIRALRAQLPGADQANTPAKPDS